nr:hypothetical protein [Pseudomonadota bacterium]
KLIGLFEYRKKNFLGKYLEGSYQFKGRQEFLDEIYVKEKDLDSFRGRDNNINIGVTGKFYKGSDHKLVWVRFEK